MKAKKILAAFLAATMVLSTMSFTAFANESTGESTTPAALVEITPTYDWYTAEATEYEIDSVSDLAGFAKLTQTDVTIDETTLTKTDFAEKTVKLTAPLTFAEGEYWYYDNGTTVIDYRVKAFAGTFDGNNNSISNMSYAIDNYVANNTVAFFSSIVAGGSIKNLTIDTVNVTYSVGGTFNTFAASIAGEAINCHAKNVTVSSNKQITVNGFGKIDGASASADGCSVDGLNITTTYENSVAMQGGGFGGSANGATITNCDVKNVTATCYGEMKYSGFGYTTGVCENNNVENITMLIKGPEGWTKDCAGFGGASSTSSVKNCHVKNIKYISESPYSLRMVGGFTTTTNGTFENCTVTDINFDVVGSTTDVGGFSPIINPGTELKGCRVDNIKFNLGTNGTSGADAVGGFAGKTQGGSYQNTPAIITDCHVTGLDMNVGKAQQWSHPLAGFISVLGSATNITDCTVTGKINAPDFAYYKNGELATASSSYAIGGFIGDLGWGTNDHSIIERCTANVEINTNAAAGGFIAQVNRLFDNNSTTDITIKDCAADGNVTSTENAAGGFVAVGNRGTFDGCEANGAVEGEVAGGFWGELRPNKAADEENPVTVTITNSTATQATVTGTEKVSDFVNVADKTVEAEDMSFVVENVITTNTNNLQEKDAETGDVKKAENPVKLNDTFIKVSGDSVNYLSLENAVKAASAKGATVTFGGKSIAVEKYVAEVSQEAASVGASAENTVIDDINGVVAKAAAEEIKKSTATNITVARKDVVVYESNVNNKLIVDITPTLTVDGAPVELNFKDTDVKVTVKVDNALEGTTLDIYHADDETAFTTATVENGKVTFTTDKGFSKYTIDGSKVAVDTSKIADGIDVVLEKTENDNQYFVKLVGKDNKFIYRFATATMKFKFDTTDNLTWNIAPATGISMSEENGLYLFNANGLVIDTINGVTNPEATITKGEIILGTVTFNTYGTFTFNVETDAKVQGVKELEHSNMKEYTVAGGNLTVDIVSDVVGTENAGDAIIDNVTLAEKKAAMTIELVCDNFVENTSDKDYQSMTIKIEREGRPDQTKTISLYKDQSEQITADSDIKSVTYYNNANEVSKYVAVVELPVNADYKITLSGAGYRTYSYKKDNFTVATTLRFWNDEEHKLPEEIEVGSGKKFVTTFLAGDIIEDTKIDIYDLNAVVSYWGTDNAKDYATYNRYDLNRDGKIDQTDVTYVLMSWGY